MAASDVEALVVLAGGVVVSRAALRLLWALEGRGCTIRLEPDGALFVGPKRAVSDTDAAAIRRHRDELVRLVESCEAVQ